MGKTDLWVWAPRATQVDVLIDGGRWPMTGPDEFGGWCVTVEDVEPGANYWYSLDGGPPRPDPRSRFQPAGVDGPSALVDHSSFSWNDSTWVGRTLDQGALIYELHVGTFSATGTFGGAIEHLGHLVKLGVTHIELMPVAEFSGRWGWGYDGVDLFAPHHAYGGPQGLKQLVDACHGHGLAVVLDVVYNHVGPVDNYLDEFGPYFTDRYATPWGRAVNLDGPDSDQVRAFFVDNAVMWLRDYHVDGLRLDAVHAILDTSALHFLEELAVQVSALEAEVGRPLALIAESDLNDPKIVRDRAEGGYGLLAQWSDDFHHSIHALFTGERVGYYADFGTLGHLAKALRQALVYDGVYSQHRRRRHGRPPVGVPLARFLGYLQTHDQVGNRPQGDRLGMLISPGRLRAAAALVLCSPFVPMLFQGEEWGASSPFPYFTDHADPELGLAVCEGRRREFAALGWNPAEVSDPQDPATFERSRLDWTEVGSEPHASLLDWYRALVALRGQHRLHEGDLGTVRVDFDEHAGWLILDRGSVMVVVNVGTSPAEVPLVVSQRDYNDANVVLSWGEVELLGGSARMGPDSLVLIG